MSMASRSEPSRGVSGVQSIEVFLTTIRRPLSRARLQIAVAPAIQTMPNHTIGPIRLPPVIAIRPVAMTDIRPPPSAKILSASIRAWV